MPLKEVETPYYLSRTRIFVDSNKRNKSRSKSQFNYTFDVGQQIQNVISIELTGWCFNSFFAPSFSGRYNTPFPTQDVDTVPSIVPGMHTFDTLVYDENTPAVESILIPGDLEFLVPGIVPVSQCWQSFASRQALVDAIGVHLLTAFVFLFQNSTSSITPADTTLSLNLTDENKLEMYFYRTAGAMEPMPSFFMFRSGPTSDDNAGKPAGFNSTTDTSLSGLTETAGIGSGFNYVVLSDYIVNVQPFRYLDVTVKETNEDFVPLARVYLNRTYEEDNIHHYVRPCNEGMNARLLTNPVRRLDRLTILITLENDYRLSDAFASPHQLTFDVLSLAQVPIVPRWIEQRLFL